MKVQLPLGHAPPRGGADDDIMYRFLFVYDAASYPV